MSDQHPPPTDGKKNRGTCYEHGPRSAEKKSPPCLKKISLGFSYDTPQDSFSQEKQKLSDIDRLIATAHRLAQSAPPDDGRHALILHALLSLAHRKHFGPRFGDANHKPRLEIQR